MKAVVLAGGFGTRIQPLTHSIPKPMLPVVNRPIMEHVLERVKSAGITEVVVLLYHQADVIKDYFKDGKEFGVNIIYIKPERDFGTAGAVKQAQEHLNETFLVISGDLITDFELQELITFHKAKGSKVTLGLYSVENPLQFGVVITNKEGRIIRFLEKPGWGQVFSDTVNTGIYVIEPEILSYIPKDEFFDFAKDLFPKLMKEGIPLYGKKLEGYWKDIGNIDAYREVHFDIFSGKVKISIPGELKRFKNGKLYVEEGVKLEEGVEIKGMVVLGKNVKVKRGAKLTDTVVGADSEIGENSEIQNGIIWWNVKIGDNVHLRNAVICDEVEVGKGVEAKEGVVIAEKTKVGDNVKFVKDVVVWPGKYVEEGSIVGKNIIWESKWERGIFKGHKVVGSVNVELSPDTATKLGEAVGSFLSPGSTILIGRDYHRASRTLKRAFIAGLLATGVNAVDLHLSSLPELVYNLSVNKELSLGVYFSLSKDTPSSVEISFYNSDGLPIDLDAQKSIERIFFRETYRLENYTDLGIIKEDPYSTERYIEGVLQKLDGEKLKLARYKVVYDLLYSPVSLVVPKLLTKLGIDSVLINSALVEEKLANINVYAKGAEERVSKIVKALNYDVGFVISTLGDKLSLVAENGEVVTEEKLLFLTLLLLDRTAKKKLRAYLPVWAPEILDPLLENVIVERGRFTNLHAQLLVDFDFVGNTDGSLIFTEHSLGSDGVYALLKILEMIAETGKKVSELLEEIPKYAYIHNEYPCEFRYKGKVIRYFSEYASDRNASFVEGVKIYEDKNSWVLILPDAVKETVHIYSFSTDRQKAEGNAKRYESLLREVLSE